MLRTLEKHGFGLCAVHILGDSFNLTAHTNRTEMSYNMVRVIKWVCLESRQYRGCLFAWPVINRSWLGGLNNRNISSFSWSQKVKYQGVSVFAFF